MKKEIVILLLIIFIGGLLFPFLTLAGDYQVDGGTVHYEGLVPCGKAKVSSGESDEVTGRCQFCHLFVMLDGIITFVLFDILPPVAVLMMVIAGVMFFFGGGNPSLLLQAKKLITSIVIGLVIIFSAYLIVGAVLSTTGVLGWTTLDKWLDNGTFTVNCPIGEGGGAGVVAPGEEEGENGGPGGGGGAGAIPGEEEEEEESKCEDCGAGFWNLCDKEECLSLGDCVWTQYWGLASGFCKPITPGPYLSQKEAITKLTELGIEVYNLCPNENCNDSVPACGGTDYTYVCLNGLPITIIDKLGDIKEACNCNILITGGTEKFGHEENTPHGYGEAVVDLDDYSELENWFESNSDEDGPSWCPSYGTGYELNDGSAEFCDEGDHLHFELK